MTHDNKQTVPGCNLFSWYSQLTHSISEREMGEEEGRQTESLNTFYLCIITTTCGELLKK